MANLVRLEFVAEQGERGRERGKKYGQSVAVSTAAACRGIRDSSAPLATRVEQDIFVL
jgi:hypothetical protein